MPMQFASLAHASVQQLRDAIRRVTVVHTAARDERDEQAFLAGIEVSDSSWHEWQETTFDVRQIHV